MSLSTFCSDLKTSFKGLKGREFSKLKKQGFILSSGILIGSVIITKILGMMFKIPLTNILGGTGTGYYSCAYAVFMPMFAVCVSGIPASMSRIISEYSALKKYACIRRTKRIAMLFFSFAGAIFTLLTVLLAYPICKFIMNEPASLWSVIAIAPCIIIGAVASVERGYYEGLRNMTPTALNEIMEGIFKIVFGLWFAYKALSIANESFAETGKVFGKICHSTTEASNASLPYVSAGAVLGVTVANCVALIIILIADRIRGDGISREMMRSDDSNERMRHLLLRLVRLCIPIAISSVITTLTSMVDLITINRCLEVAIKTDKDYFLRKFSGVILTGTSLKMLPNFIYGSYSGLAITVFSLVPSLTAMFSKSAVPLVSENYAIQDKKAVSKSINAVLFATSVIIIPSALGIFIFSEEILTLLFSRRQQEILCSYEILKIMCPGMVFSGLSVPLFSILQGIGNANIPVIIMLTGCAVKMILNVILVSIPEINILGAGIASTVCYGIIFIASLYFVLKQTKAEISFDKLFYKPFFAGVLCCTVAKAIFDLIGARINLVTSIGVSIISGGIIYIFTLYLLSVLTKNELKTLFLK